MQGKRKMKGMIAHFCIIGALQDDRPRSPQAIGNKRVATGRATAFQPAQVDTQNRAVLNVWVPLWQKNKSQPLDIRLPSRRR